MDTYLEIQMFGKRLSFRVRLDTLPLQVEAIEGMSSLLRALVANTELDSSINDDEKKSFLQSIKRQHKELNDMKRCIFKNCKSSARQGLGDSTRLTTLVESGSEVESPVEISPEKQLSSGEKGNCQTDRTDISPRRIQNIETSKGRANHAKLRHSEPQSDDHFEKPSKKRFWKLYWPTFTSNSEVLPCSRTNSTATLLFHSIFAARSKTA